MNSLLTQTKVWLGRGLETNEAHFAAWLRNNNYSIRYIVWVFVIIKVERSGGFAGIPISNEMDAKDLPSTLISTAKKIMVDKKLPSLPLKGTPREAADYYCYKISFQDGINRRVINCNEHNIHDDLKSLVKYIERHSKKRRN